MASDSVPHPDRPPISTKELVAFVKRELDADAERQAKVAAAGVGDLPSQTGVTLDLSHKNITVLPVEIVVLIKDKVERLALAHNPQIALPSQIVQCDRLRYLNIRWNQLKVFPDAVLQLSQLEILDLSKNRIASIPDEINKMTSLKVLAVARNKIARLPLSLSDMTSLSRLKFEENPIVFPPPDALKSSENRVASAVEPDKELELCLQVKRFLKAASLRQRLRAPSEEDLSEGSLDTPRPPKRTFTTGRFPVRPSISGIENVDELKVKSPKNVPPIPQKSHARISSNNAPFLKRPVITPLLTSGKDISRSRSETAFSSASLRNRRQGLLMPRKPTDMLVSNDPTDSASMTTSSSVMKPAHSREPSSASTLYGFFTSSSGGESSGAVSPVEGPAGRPSNLKRLSSLPENRNSKLQTSDATKAVKRVLYSLNTLHGPLDDVTASMRECMPKRSAPQRMLSYAGDHRQELGRLLKRLDKRLEDDDRAEGQSLHAIVRAATITLKSYAKVLQQLKQHTRKIVSLIDGVYIRCVMLQLYATSVELRNACEILGSKMPPRPRQSVPRTSRALSSRTVTPSQHKPIMSRRMRGATIMQSMSHSMALRTMPPPPTSATHTGSRTNTMTSLVSAATRSGESFSSVPTSAASSRTNTMRSVTDDSDVGAHFDNIYAKLKSACSLAEQSLPHCRSEFVIRRDSAENVGHTDAASSWSLALSKCENVIVANNALISRLKVIKVKDPGLRNQRDFWQLCDEFVQSFTVLATQIKAISDQRLDVSTARTVLKPVQKTVKDVSKIIDASPLYHQAVRAPDAVTVSRHPSVASSYSTTASQIYSASGTSSGYVTPVPATPLSAALGPAVQATVASMPPLATHGSHDHAPAGYARAGRDRADTVLHSQYYGPR